MSIKDIAQNIAKIHIAKYEAMFELTEVSENNYFAVISHSKLSSNIEEHINLNGLPKDIAEEYMHCRVHGLAAKLISKLYPEKIFPL